MVHGIFCSDRVTRRRLWPGQPASWASSLPPERVQRAREVPIDKLFGIASFFLCINVTTS
jgi:hypothetical protein